MSLKPIRQYGEDLTARQLQVLCKMRDDPEADGELVYESGSAYVGLDRTTGQTVFALLRACAIQPSQSSGKPGEFEIFELTEIGGALIPQVD